MRRTLALAVFFIAAIAIDVLLVRAVSDRVGLSADWRSFLTTFLGVLTGLYGGKVFARFWPKPRNGFAA